MIAHEKLAKTRISVSISHEYLERLDFLAKQQKLSRSAYISKFIANSTSEKVVMLSKKNYKMLNGNPSMSMIINGLLSEFFRLYDEGKIKLPSGFMAESRPKAGIRSHQ